jgi:hypothetical protein
MYTLGAEPDVFKCIVLLLTTRSSPKYYYVTRLSVVF